MENENLVEQTENVESTTEETGVKEPEPRTYTQEEVDKLLEQKDSEVNTLVKRRVARKMKQYEREMDAYKDTENVLKHTIGGETPEEVNANLRNIYEKDNVALPERYHSDDSHDIEILAKADADETLSEGYDVAEDEANRLAQKGYDNMTAREKVYFTTLAESLNRAKEDKTLLGLGASKSLLDDQKFKDFRNKFNEKTPIEEIYKIYENTLPKEKVKTPGSLENSVDSKGVKNFYTYEEASKFTRKQLDENPELFKAIEKSMTKW